MILTPAQVQSFQRAIAVVNEVRPQLELLEAVAVNYPPLAVTAADLRSRADQLQAQAEAALAANGSTGDKQGGGKQGG